MTYTVIARDAGTGQLGIGIATYSLAVGASCPHIRAGVGAVSTQAATYAPHGPATLDLLASGVRPPEVFGHLAKADPDFEYRQIGLVTASGQVAVRTGGNAREWKGSLMGQGWLVMGNVLAGSKVAESMADALVSAEGEPLARRLMTSLEAGRNAGGQVGLNGRHLPERSAVITVYGAEPFAKLDLRVDDYPDAVTEMRRILDRFLQAESYYADRASRPASTPPQDQWMAEHGLE